LAPKARTQTIAAALCAAMAACALVAAPRSCNGGLEAYVLTGVFAVSAMFVLPIVLRTDRDAIRRVGLGALFAAVGAAVWIAGLFGANVRIACRLF